MPRGIPKKVDEHGEPERVKRADERRAKRPALIDVNQFYNTTDTAAAREQSVATLYADIAAGKIKATKRGKRTVILGAEIVRANLAEAAK